MSFPTKLDPRLMPPAFQHTAGSPASAPRAQPAAAKPSPSRPAPVSGPQSPFSFASSLTSLSSSPSQFPSFGPNASASSHSSPSAGFSLSDLSRKKPSELILGSHLSQSRPAEPKMGGPLAQKPSFSSFDSGMNAGSASMGFGTLSGASRPLVSPPSLPSFSSISSDEDGDGSAEEAATGRESTSMDCDSPVPWKRSNNFDETNYDSDEDEPKPPTVVKTARSGQSLFSPSAVSAAPAFAQGPSSFPASSSHSGSMAFSSSNTGRAPMSESTPPSTPPRTPESRPAAATSFGDGFSLSSASAASASSPDAVEDENMDPLKPIFPTLPASARSLEAEREEDALDDAIFDDDRRYLAHSDPTDPATRAKLLQISPEKAPLTNTAPRTLPAKAPLDLRRLVTMKGAHDRLAKQYQKHYQDDMNKAADAFAQKQKKKAEAYSIRGDIYVNRKEGHQQEAENLGTIAAFMFEDSIKNGKA